MNAWMGPTNSPSNNFQMTSRTGMGAIHVASAGVAMMRSSTAPEKMLPKSRSASVTGLTSSSMTLIGRNTRYGRA